MAGMGSWGASGNSLCRAALLTPSTPASFSMIAGEGVRLLNSMFEIAAIRKPTASPNSPCVHPLFLRSRETFAPIIVFDLIAETTI